MEKLTLIKLILLRKMTLMMRRINKMTGMKRSPSTGWRWPMDMSRRERNQSEDLDCEGLNMKLMIILRGKCLGLIVEGGYMFLLDPDMSHFPLLTWHCPKYTGVSQAAIKDLF